MVLAATKIEWQRRGGPSIVRQLALPRSSTVDDTAAPAVGVDGRARSGSGVEASVAASDVAITAQVDEPGERRSEAGGGPDRAQHGIY